MASRPDVVTFTSTPSASHFELAIIGADDPLGIAVLKLIEEREIPVGRLHALTLGEADSSVTFQEQDWPCEAATDFDYGRAQALLVASRRPAAQALAGQVRTAHPHMPVLLVDEVDPSPAQAVARVARTLARLGGGLEADAWVALPVGYLGQEGVEELANQSRALFQMETPEAEVFPLQIAFNLLPFGSPAEAPLHEARLAEATARQAPGAIVDYSLVWAPMFFGAALVLHARMANSVEIADLRTGLARQDGIVLMEAELPAATPTPATDAQGSEAVFVSRIRGAGKRFRLWLVFDPIQLEAARMVDIVENWIDKPVDSMLT